MFEGLFCCARKKSRLYLDEYVCDMFCIACVSVYVCFCMSLCVFLNHVCMTRMCAYLCIFLCICLFFLFLCLFVCQLITVLKFGSVVCVNVFFLMCNFFSLVFV